MRRTRTTTLALAAATLASLGLVAAPAQAAGPPSGFVIDTQFSDADADVAGWGAFASCTSATSVNDEPDGRTHSQALFSGLKILHCADDSTVTVGFTAFITFPAPTGQGGAFKTFGDWWVVDSTVAGVSAGGGKLMGDSRTCEIEPGSGGCITDTFRGYTS